jgi:hypothetical protein
MYPTEYLNMITASGLSLHKITLKVGSPVMVLRNLNPAEGVCNETRGIITCITIGFWNFVFWEVIMMDSWYFCQESSAILQMHRFHSSFVVFSFVLEMLSLCLLIRLKDSLSNVLALIFILLFSLMD